MVLKYFTLLFFTLCFLPQSGLALEFNTSEIKSCDPVNIKSCFGSVDRDPTTGIFEIAKSFEFVHRENNKPVQQDQVVVLVHGLLDSPYYLKDIARIFYNHGYNVVVMRLSGHGTKPEDLMNVKLDDWRADLTKAIAYGRTLGKHLSIGGYSTGGALMLELAYKDPQVEQLFLFSPAVNLKNPLTSLSCLASFFGVKWAETQVPEDNPVNYRNIPMNAVCQLNQLIRSISNWYRWTDLKQLKIPVFVAYTLDDRIIQPDTLNTVALNLSHPKSVAVVFAATASAHCKMCKEIQSRYGNYFDISSEMVTHGEVPVASNDYYVEKFTNRYQFNRRFSVLENGLNKFLESLSR